MIDRELQNYTGRPPWNPNDRERSSGYRDLHINTELGRTLPAHRRRKKE